MAMTVNPAATPDCFAFHEEGLYAFRFDVDGDAREEVTFKIRFGDVSHAGAGQHTQEYQVLRATGADAAVAAGGQVLAEGQTGQIVDGKLGTRVYTGAAADMFFANRDGLHQFKDSYVAGTFEAVAFDAGVDFFDGRSVTAIVVEVPESLIGTGTVRAWATVSLVGHAPEVQVSRWGLPLLTHLYITDADMQEQYNRATPAQDSELFASQVSAVVEKMTRQAGSAADPAAYGKLVADRLIPTTLPYELGTWAAFSYAGFNGRGFTDDVMDVQLSIMTNTALSDGVPIPARPRARAEFPYFGAAHRPG
jgi:hypothetical protein